MMHWPRHLAPGAAEARRAGCTCSAVRNAYGRGDGDADNPTFVIATHCPHHAVAAAPAREPGGVR